MGQGFLVTDNSRAVFDLFLPFLARHSPMIRRSHCSFTSPKAFFSDVPAGGVEAGLPGCRRMRSPRTGRFKVIGEEVVPGRPLPPEAFVPISEGFVLYPARRSGGDVPCSFILPAFGFPPTNKLATVLIGFNKVTLVT